MTKRMDHEIQLRRERQRENAARHRQNTGFRFVRREFDAMEIRRAELKEREQAKRVQLARELKQIARQGL